MTDKVSDMFRQDEIDLGKLEHGVLTLEQRLKRVEDALRTFWIDRDIWDFNDLGVPNTWYPLGEIAEALEEEDA